MTNLDTYHFSLYDDVIKPGYCIGCGVCKTVASDAISIEFDENGFYQAKLSRTLSEEEELRMAKICPFSSFADSETVLGKQLFGHQNEYDSRLGFINSSYAIRVEEGRYRENATSAGFTSWILSELLKRGYVDAVIHVGSSIQESKKEGSYFKYKISTTVEEIQQRSKTRYFPIEMGTLLSKLKDDNRKFAIVGLPCFIKSVQLLRKSSPEWNERLKFTVSIFCGHLKSRFFTENLIDAMNVNRRTLKSIDFRRKLPGNPANVYIMGVETESGWTNKDMNEVPGSDWGSGSFKYYACNFCDDVIGETADVSVGDAWLAKYKGDGNGTNNVVIRNVLIDHIINEALADNRLWVENLTAGDVYNSTKGGFEDRREGTAYRVELERKGGGKPPLKRADSYQQLTHLRREVFAFKMFIGVITPPLFRVSRKLHIIGLFRVFIKLLIGCYRRRWPGFLFKTTFFSRLMILSVKRK